MHYGIALSEKYACSAPPEWDKLGTGKIPTSIPMKPGDTILMTRFSAHADFKALEFFFYYYYYNISHTLMCKCQSWILCASHTHASAFVSSRAHSTVRKKNSTGQNNKRRGKMQQLGSTLCIIIIIQLSVVQHHRLSVQLLFYIHHKLHYTPRCTDSNYFTLI